MAHEGHLFSRASEKPYKRRPADVFRLVASLGVIVWLSSDSGHSSDIALSIFQAVNGLPGDLRPVADFLYDLATLSSVAVVAAAALGARRWRLALDLLLAGALAWLVARGLGLVLADGFRRGLSATVRSRGSAAFPDVPLSVVVAVAATAAPYLGRPVRWLSGSLAGLLLPVEMYLGTALPKALGCAIALGIASAACVHLGFGSPAGRPTFDQVQEALHDLGVVAANNIRLASLQPAEHTMMLADDGDARLVIKVLGRDERDAQRLAKLWRFLVYRDSGPTLFLTRLQEVEHQAYVMLLAQQSGVRIAPLVVAGAGGLSTVLLAEREVPGTPLSDLPASEVTDAVLTDLWLQVGQLHHARIAHGRLTTRRVVVDKGLCTLVGFERAEASATTELRAGDTAELLATTSALVGHERALTAAMGMGAPELAAGLPLLQSAALSRDARQLVGSDLDEHLTALREQGAAAVGEPVPELEKLRRVSGPTAALAASLVIGVGALLTVIGDPSHLADLVRRARPGPLAATVVLSLASNIGFALSLAGSTRKRLPFWKNVKVQVAGSFSNIAFPLGSQALQIRFLQKQGLSGAAAVAGGGIVNLLGGTAAQLVLLGLALEASPGRIDLGEIPAGAITRTLEVATAVLLTVSVLVLVVPVLRHRVLPPFTRGAQALLEVARSPRQLSLLLGGSLLAYVLSSVALSSTLLAFGQSLPIAEVIAVSVGVTLIAALVPLPGGGGAVATVGLSGALISLGVPRSEAVATALMNPIIAQYGTALPGWLALRSLLKHGDL